MAAEGIEELPRSYPHPPPSDLPLPPPPPSQLSSWRYDVFLSFSGQDTRENFTDHLYTGLVERGIKTYRDDKKLARGNVITATLLRAIERSRMSIIVFSKNYAASRWCLDELVKIVKCNKLTGHMILPVFLNVKPDHVSKQTGAYRKAFRDHEKEFKKKRVDKWRNALKKVTDVSGWDKDNYRSESKLIKIIGHKILRKLRKAGPSVDKQLHQLDSKVKEMNLKLYEKLDDIGTIRFCGLRWGRKIWDSAQENNLTRKRQHSKQVHVIVDEVYKLEQLVSFSRKQDWFGPGSRIIISSGDPSENIMDVLHISFDGPTGRDKVIFLDIVCFFKEMNEDHTMRIKKLLFGGGLHISNIGTKVLIDTFTITISDDHNLLIHDRRHNMLEIREIDGLTWKVFPSKPKSTKGTNSLEPQSNGAPLTQVSKPRSEVEDSTEPSKTEATPLKETFFLHKFQKEPTTPETGILSVPETLVSLQQIPVGEEIEAIKAKTHVYANATPAQAEKEAEEEATSPPDGPKAPGCSTVLSSQSSSGVQLPNVLETVITAETAQVQRKSLLGKSKELSASLLEEQEKLSSLEVKLSRITEEEERLEMEIQELIARKEKLLDSKRLTALQLERTNKKASKDQANWNKMEEQIKQANDNYYEAKEKLALANASWKFFKECLEL
ncbi:hypothetical protein RCOM_1333460 [Ricinus communis]|uniref:TIR domain-containing protein n=1 Tax=Ricinus communis TaxID=3988 RepID=B9S744_RICCO|nr:hypothetical protein RCOM_1333460 [Ricinus communis]